MSASLASRNITLDLIDDAPGDNPNVMDPVRYASLVEAIRAGDFYQPVLVRPNPSLPGRFIIVDGTHRRKAMHELGAVDMPCIVADLNEEQARAVRIGMNRLRGELDLGVVASTLAELSSAGWDTSALTTTGFTPTEVEDLIKSTQVEDLTVGPVAGLGGEVEDKDPDAKVDKPFVIELTFTNQKDRDRAKRGLRKAAGGGKYADLAAGLLRLIDGA